MSIVALVIGIVSVFAATLAALCWYAARVARQDELYAHRVFNDQGSQVDQNLGVRRLGMGNRRSGCGDRQSIRGGRHARVSYRATISVLAVSFSFLLIMGPNLAVGVALTALVAIAVSRRTMRRRKMATFDRQIQNALPMVAQSLRAGQTIQTAFSSVGECMTDPLKRELARVNTEVTLAGVSLEDSLEALAQRMSSQDVAFLATIIGVQKVGGGKMAELIDTVADRITRRQALRRHIKAVTAQARLVSKIIACAPIAVLALFLLGSPDIARTFWASPIWPLVVITILILDTLGLLCVRRIYSMPTD